MNYMLRRGTMFFLLLCSCSQIGWGQILFPYHETTELFCSHKDNKCIDQITEDSITDTFYEFAVMEKKGKMVMRFLIIVLKIM